MLQKIHGAARRPGLGIRRGARSALPEEPPELAGGLVGTLLGVGLNLLLSIRGIDFSGMTAETEVPMDNVIIPGVHPLHILALFCVGVAISSLVAFLPSRSAARMDPIEAIRSA